MGFHPAGTVWALYRFAGDGVTGRPDRTWCFQADWTIRVDGVDAGSYQPVSGEAGVFRCELVGPGGPKSPPIVYQVYFVTAAVLVVLLEGAAMFLGERIRDVIELTVVVDTASLPSAAGTSPERPAPCDRGCGFLITDQQHAGTGNGTTTLTLRSAIGEQLRLWATSVTGQFQDEVFVYDLRHAKGDRVLDVKGLRQQSYASHAMVPVVSGQVGHPPPECTVEPRAFPCGLLDITGGGTESFSLRFLVYGTTTGAAGQRAVKGYYQWEPSITTV